jgi:hypothetical protein
LYYMIRIYELYQLQINIFTVRIVLQYIYRKEDVLQMYCNQVNGSRWCMRMRRG